jgi:hypothetical protein
MVQPYILFTCWPCPTPDFMFVCGRSYVPRPDLNFFCWSTISDLLFVPVAGCSTRGASSGPSPASSVRSASRRYSPWSAIVRPSICACAPGRARTARSALPPSGTRSAIGLSSIWAAAAVPGAEKSAGFVRCAATVFS